MNYLRDKVNTSQRAGFTIIEIFVVVGIVAILSGIAIASGSRSLERSKINAVALELAGWLTAIHAKDSTGCFVDYENATDKTSTVVSDMLVIPQGKFASGDKIFALRNPSGCSAPSEAFRLPGNVGGDYQLSLYTPIVFSPRGTVAIASNSGCDSSAIANATCKGSDIKIFRLGSGSGLLRCIRINYWTGIVEIGSNSNAASIANDCTSFDRF
jgi:hypothetical protein